ncbi:hypothetical protein [Vallitalea guaymasensis]|uniref:Uncharacterized protein n=1 Tax=Vallitalea guaymasensis TaxID=1185412 RepID=A0A8J8MFE2_9FIRM|nr:hypothetical protein [Vallitalea guaymasensis]QUH31635.1 hypothetical protein HYG85_22970 [Vallitalea guaymasensis]
MISVNVINTLNWGKCIKLSNQKIELIATTDFGPRIILFSYVNGVNMLYEETPSCNDTKGDVWHFYGGHRLWYGPQIDDRYLYPDNQSVKWRCIESTLILTQEIEKTTGIQKEIIINMDPKLAKVTINHKITNHSCQPIKLCVWALTCMSPGGREIIPLPKVDSRLLASYSLAFWPFTNPSDSRFYLGKKIILLDHNPIIKDEFKIGISSSHGIAGYNNHNTLFIKKYDIVNDADYADYSSDYQTYVNEHTLELESLGPYMTLNPKSSTSHTEAWYLFPNIPYPKTESEVMTCIMPLFDNLMCQRQI